MNPAGLDPIASRAGFEAALHETLRAAMARGARRICLVDPDFKDWPLDALLPNDAFTGWLRLPLRKLVLLARDYGAFDRLHPRFVSWRRTWAHAIDVCSPEEGLDGELPCVLVDDGPISLQLVDKVHWRGGFGVDARQARTLRDQVDALLQRSGPAFPVHMAGL